MDVVVIGKKSFKQSEPPVVIYCGQSRDEAYAVVAEKLVEFPYCYLLDPHPYKRLTESVINPPRREPVVLPKPEPESDAGQAQLDAEKVAAEPEVQAEKPKPAKAPKAPKPPKPTKDK